MPGQGAAAAPHGHGARAPPPPPRRGRPVGSRVEGRGSWYPEATAERPASQGAGGRTQLPLPRRTRRSRRRGRRGGASSQVRGPRLARPGRGRCLGRREETGPAPPFTAGRRLPAERGDLGLWGRRSLLRPGGLGETRGGDLGWSQGDGRGRAGRPLVAGLGWVPGVRAQGPDDADPRRRALPRRRARRVLTEARPSSRGPSRAQPRRRRERRAQPSARRRGRPREPLASRGLFGEGFGLLDLKADAGETGLRSSDPWKAHVASQVAQSVGFWLVAASKGCGSVGGWVEGPLSTEESRVRFLV